MGLAFYGVWEQNRTFPTSKTTSIGYEPQVGDLVFQSSPLHDLTIAIQGATRSPLSHCGIVALNSGRWVVVEAIATVRETELGIWFRRGRGRKVAVYRLADEWMPHVPAIIAAAREFRGRPYDTRYRMDDEAIYCSELVYKAFERATGSTLGTLVPLGDLDWKPFEATIRKYEGGAPPLDRLMITPRDLASAPELSLVFDNGI